MIYRIYTEYKPGLSAIVAAHFDGFTMESPAVGYWQGKAEHCQVIEIVADADAIAFEMDARVRACAEAIRSANKQQAVLVVGLTCNTIEVTGKESNSK